MKYKGQTPIQEIKSELAFFVKIISYFDTVPMSKFQITKNSWIITVLSPPSKNKHPTTTIPPLKYVLVICSLFSHLYNNEQPQTITTKLIRLLDEQLTSRGFVF